LTTASTAGSPAFRDHRVLQWICIAGPLAIAIAGYHPDKVFDYFLENGCVAAVSIGLVATHRKFVFSDLSYLLMFIFLCIHEMGAHYKYSDVPLGEWMKPLLHTTRNDFDKVAHTSFGLLFAYPLREIAMRVWKVRGKWLYYLPVEGMIAVSAVYEMLEALMAQLLTPARGEEFVGMQGDIWDSQQDMFSAFVGSVIAMLIIAAAVKWRDSLRAKKNAKTEYASVK